MATRKVTNVAVFKNKGARIDVQIQGTPDAEGFITTTAPADALDGTVDVTVDGQPAFALVTEQVTETKKPFATTFAFLSANLGCSMTSNDLPYRLPIVRFDQDKAYTEQGTAEDLTNVRVSNPKALWDTSRIVQRVMRIHTGEKGLAELHYVTKSLSWRPTYVVKAEDAKAEVQLFAEVENMAENIQDVDVSFLTHTPQLSSDISALSSNKRPKTEKAEEGVAFGSSAAAAACAMSAPPVRCGDDDDTFQLVIPKCTLPLSTSRLLLASWSVECKYLYELQGHHHKTATAQRPQKSNKWVALVNNGTLPMLASDAALLSSCGVPLGVGKFPQVPVGTSNRVLLYESTEVTMFVEQGQLHVRNGLQRPVRVKLTYVTNECLRLSTSDVSMIAKRADFGNETNYTYSWSATLPPGTLVL